MLDTSVCVSALRERSAVLRRRFNEEAENLCISSITLTELLHGAAKSARPAHNRAEVFGFAARLTVLGFDETAADHAADIRAALESRGMPIGTYDLLTGGHARGRGLVVVTGNLREFRRIDGLRSEDWMAHGPW